MPDRGYHHGDLRRALVEGALEEVDERGLDDMSIRSVARRVGVSHAAPAHHFGNREGLLRAVAARGFELLAAELRSAVERGGPIDAGRAYVNFGLRHPQLLALMFGPRSRSDDGEVEASRQKTAAALRSAMGVEDGGDGDRSLVLAAWALAHGLVTLLLAGQVEPHGGEDAEALVRSVLGRLRMDQP